MMAISYLLPDYDQVVVGGGEGVAVSVEAALDVVFQLNRGF